jgi:ABC-type transport system involved in multi-copper enzyme maturation permease subunit
MKRNIRVISIAFMMLFCMAFVTCATFQTNSYKTLTISADTYETMYPQFVKLHDNKIVSDADFSKGKDLAQKYHDAWHIAQVALQTYATVGGSQDKVNATISQMGNCLSAFVAYVQPYLSKGGK